MPRGDRNSLSNRRPSENISEMFHILYWADSIGCSTSASPYCSVGCFSLKKKAGGREVGEMSLELERRRNWSQTQQTTSGSLTAAWNKHYRREISAVKFFSRFYFRNRQEDQPHRVVQVPRVCTMTDFLSSFNWKIRCIIWHNLFPLRVSWKE